jgi:hypothetical protein
MQAPQSPSGSVILQEMHSVADRGSYVHGGRTRAEKGPLLSTLTDPEDFGAAEREPPR